LLQLIWNDKNGKQDLGLSLGMYVEIPQYGKINLNQFCSAFLKELIETQADSFSWARDFGRVIVGISTRKAKDCKTFTLIDKSTNEDETKSFTTVKEHKLINPS